MAYFAFFNIPISLISETDDFEMFEGVISPLHGRLSL